MRGPLEVLMTSISAALGVTMTAVGESGLSDLKVRPDYAIKVNGAVTGYVEVKRPGKGADPTTWSPKGHDGQQWEKLKALPNVLYTDGQEWGLYRTGERVGDGTRLVGDIRNSGSKLAAPDDSLARMLSAFLHWEPVAPRQIRQLVRSVAPLTRLLRDEVTDTLSREAKAGGGPFTSLAEDWRALLFPGADDARVRGWLRPIRCLRPAAGKDREDRLHWQGGRHDRPRAGQDALAPGEGALDSHG